MKLEAFIPGIELWSANETLRASSRRARFRQAAHARKTKSDVTMVLQSRFGKRPPFGLPVVVCITRVSPGEFDRHDNLPHGAKHVTDAVADWFGKADRDKGFTWTFDQIKGRHHGIKIAITGNLCGDTSTCKCCGATVSCQLERGHDGPCERRP
jgi:hypothetical protein